MFISIYGDSSIRNICSSCNNIKKLCVVYNKKGNIGIGSKRSRIRNNIVIIACDNQGKIVDGELMEGLTVFTKFKQIPDIIGKDIFLLKEEYEALSKKEKNNLKVICKQ